MPLELGLNNYTYTELEQYPYSEIENTPYFGIMIVVRGSSNTINTLPPGDTITVTFSSAYDVDEWECRATLESEPFSPGVGILLASGGEVSANNEMNFYVSGSNFVDDEGRHRIAVYVKKYDLWLGE